MAIELPNGKKVNAMWIIAALIMVISQLVAAVPGLIDVTTGGNRYEVRQAIEEQTKILERLADVQERQLRILEEQRANLHKGVSQQFSDEDADAMERRLKLEINRR